MTLNRRTVLVGMAAASGAAALTACNSTTDPTTTPAAPGGTTSDSPAAAEEVTISVGELPPTEQEAWRQQFMGLIDQFQKQNPNITIDAVETKYDPQTFNAMLAGGTLPTTLNVPFTETKALIERGQVKDLTPFFEGSAVLSDLNPEVLKQVQDADGNLFGVPYEAYTMALLYNRQVFQDRRVPRHRRGWARQSSLGSFVSVWPVCPAAGRATRSSSNWGCPRSRRRRERDQPHLRGHHLRDPSAQITLGAPG